MRVVEDGMLSSYPVPLVSSATSPNLGTLLNDNVPGASLRARFDDKPPKREGAYIRGLLVSVLSCFYALTLVLLAFSFEVSIIISESNYPTKYQPFYIYLYTVAVLFFLYCHLFLLRSKGYKCCGAAIPVPFYETIRKSDTSNGDSPEQNSVFSKRLLDRLGRSFRMPNLRAESSFLARKRMVTHTAPSAGSMYLRLGAVVFGVISMIENGLLIVNRVEKRTCANAADIFVHILSIVFTFWQLYFIFLNNKLTIHRFKNIGRFGTMHVVATNLCIWIRSVVLEEITVLREITESMKKSKNQTSHTAEPFSVYSHDDPYKVTVHVHPKTTTEQASLLSWSSFFDRSISSYSDNPCESSDTLISQAKSFLTTCLIEYSIICAAVMFILWWNIGGVKHADDSTSTKERRHDFHVDCSSSVKGLFAGLFVVVFAFCSMILFLIKINLQDETDALWVFYMSDALLYMIALIASVVALYRIRGMKPTRVKENSVHIDNILLVLALFGQLIFCLFSMTGAQTHSVISYISVAVSFLRSVQVMVQTIVILAGQHLVAASLEHQRDKPGRETITFLMIVNIALFLMMTFETTKAGSHPIMLEFYGRGPWTLIVHSTVPLCIFYRFHSSVCFAEIWKNMYRTK